jgi:hypothetical protein
MLVRSFILVPQSELPYLLKQPLEGIITFVLQCEKVTALLRFNMHVNLKLLSH